jgi:autotransporter-associated beta strand protein
LTLGTANTFSGLVDIYEGTLQTDSDTALGATTAGTTIHDGATLNLNGRNLGGEVLTASGAGVGGQGAIINTGGTQNQSVRQIILAGDTTFGGSATWAINNGGGTASLSTGGNPFNLAKVGVNQVNLAQLASVDASLADIDIQEGTLEFSGLTPNMGESTRTNFVRSGATLAFANSSVTWNKQFVFHGNGATTTLNNGTGANCGIASPVELHGDCIFNVGGTMLSVTGDIVGDGGLIKNGGSPLVLHGVNTYQGDTRINTAALRLNGTATIANSSNIIINAGATLTVTGRVDSTFTLVNNQTLQGNGVISGHLIANAGSAVAPGLDAIGALTISNTIALSGSTVMELDEANLTNDVLRCGGAVTYGGTLHLVNLGGPLSAGASFKLFNASGYLGTFSSINPPTPGPGQTWNTSALNTSGTISVVGSSSVLQFTSVTLQGNNLVMSGANGTPLGAYYVRASTNVGLALASWTRIQTNAFNGSGNFTFTNVIAPSLPVRFFTVELP